MTRIATLFAPARRVAPLALCLVLSTCSRPYAVWVMDGSRADRLEFGLATEREGGRPEPLLAFSVDPCGVRSDRRAAARMWWITGYESAAPTPAVWKLAYGETPPSLTVRRAARPLTRGCYTAYAEAAGGRHGSAVFEVRADGGVREFTRAELSASAEREDRQTRGQDSVAAVRCAAGYRAARTAADTARVDAQVWYDTTRVAPTLNCQFVCTTVGPRAAPDESSKRSACRFTRYDMYGRGY